ncbi:LysE family transporter [Terrihabitans sp. B22-R8]|uniref:LysE family transporter n=1 Tax=Terrihabitans sp. B22-R8 TaxID=3425128 RepID=UPI00403CD60A
MPIDGAELATLLAIFTISMIVPGADFFCVVRESVAFGRRAGVLSALGIASAILIHATYTVLGVGLIVSQSILAFTIIKFAGAAYLLFIGIMSLRAGRKSGDAADPAMIVDRQDLPERPTSRSFGIGFLTNLLNPKATLFFVSLFTVLVSHERPVSGQAIYSLLISLECIVWFSLVAVFFTTPAIRKGFVRFGHWVSRATGLIFIALGVRLALQRAP